MRFAIHHCGRKIFFSNISLLILFFLTSSLNAQVDCPSLNADIGDVCDDGDRYTTYDKVQANCTCVGVLRNDEIAHWDFNACKAGQSFGEFTPVTSTPFGFEQVVGSVFFNTKMHSCNPGPAITKPNNNIAVCRTIRPYCFWVDESDDAYKFSIRVTPEAGEAIQLTGIEFFEKAPQIYEWTTGDTGPNNPPKMYGWRILQDGVEVGRQIDVPTSDDWSKEEFSFDSLNIITSICGETTFQFELLGYCRDGMDHDYSIWDIDEFRIFGRALPLQQLTIDDQALTTFVECDGSGNLGEFNEWLNNNGFATVFDPYGNASWTNDYDGELDYYCGDTGDREVTFTATNPCGQSVSTTATFTVQDNGDPFFIFVPSDNTLECDQPEPTDEPLAGDACSGQADVYERKYYRLDGDCPYNYQVVKEWRATDDCGIYVDAIQTITFEDNTAPQFDFVPASVTINCNEPVPTDEATYSDNCAALNEISLSLNEDIDVSPNCPQNTVITKTWTIVDACGNSSIATQVITILDTEAPEFDNAPSDFTQDCNLPVPAPPTVTATDNCDPTAGVGFNEISFPIACGSQVVRTWTATDACGNQNQTSQTITLIDTTPPTFDTPHADATFECNINTNSNEFITWLNSAGGAVASDDCSTFTISNDFVGVLTGTCGATSFVDVTFTATDNCGNASTASARFATVDNMAPDLMNPAQNQTVPCDGSGNVNNLNAWLNANGGAIATDQCMFNTPTWTNDYDPANFVADCGQTGSVEVTFTATDQCGNFIETTATFTIEDTQPPFITALPNNLVVACDDPTISTQIDDWLAIAGGAIANDACAAANITWSNSYQGLFSTTCGNTTVAFTADDGCGNTAIINSTIIVQDNFAPTFSNMPADVTIECGDPIPTDMPDVVDNCTMAFLSEMQVTVPGSCPNNIQRQFTASDQCGNSTTAVQNVTIEDTTPPTFDVLPVNGTADCLPFPDGAIPANMAILAWAADNIANVTASDDCGNVNLTNDWTGQFGVNCNLPQPAFLVIEWTATDDCGNSATTTATFEVFPQISRPIYDPEYDLIDGDDEAAIGQNGAINQFAVALKERTVNLFWVNNTGHLNDYFEVERSFDGTNFQALQWVANEGTDETALSYEAVDEAPLTGLNHYRLKTYYKDGTHQYSPIRQVKISDIEDFGLFPNPAQEEVMISLKGYEGRQTTVQLIDQLGHVLLEEQVDGNSPNHHIGLRDFRNGFYAVWIFAERRRPIGKCLIINKMY